MKETAFQLIKHLVVGGIATLIDLGVFSLIILALPAGMLPAKVISFLISVTLKYVGNKYWVFQKPDRVFWRTELFNFCCITTVGLLLDLGAFYGFTKLLGPQFGTSVVLWTKLSVIFAALVAAAWNFLGYKLLVFKK